MYLPPYSSEFNLIERLFSSI
ncbi:hypothetical protein [Wolbachia endosymbiont of Litomosoides sigmodontis]